MNSVFISASVVHSRTLTWLCPNIFLISDVLPVWLLEHSAPTWKYKERHRHVCLKGTVLSSFTLTSGSKTVLLLFLQGTNVICGGLSIQLTQSYCVGLEGLDYVVHESYGLLAFLEGWTAVVLRRSECKYCVYMWFCSTQKTLKI